MPGIIVSGRGAGLLAMAAVIGLAGCAKPAPGATTAAASSAASAAAAPALALAPAASGPDADAAKAFLEGLYAHYKGGSQDSSFQPMDANIHEVFDADIVKLMAQDAKLQSPDEVGEVNDGDWICSCQDWDSFTPTIVITAATPTTAKASVDFEPAKGEKRHNEFELVKQAGAWRVADVRSIDPPAQGSLRETLLSEIKRLSAPGAHARKANSEEAP